MDGSPDHGGRNLGIRPMEMVLIGMGGCTAYDVALMLQKSRQNVTSIELTLDSDRADEIPKVFTHIKTHFIITGKKLSEKQVARAVSLSAEKYCSASKMLEKSAEISYTFEVREAE